MDDILDLVTQARDGDREAFGLLYDRYVHDVYRFLLSKTLRKEAAQDLTSLTFMKAFEKIRSFSPKRDTSFRAWLFTIAYRSFLDEMRTKSQSPVPLEHIEELASSSSPAADAELVLLRAELHKTLEQLTKLQRETITLRVWHECSFAEIAHILGKSEASTKMHMKRGLEALKDLLPAHLFTLLLLYAAH